jgi:hypothetical protein
MSRDRGTGSFGDQTGRNFNIRLDSENHFVPAGASTSDVAREFNFWPRTESAEVTIGWQKNDLPALVSRLFPSA